MEKIINANLTGDIITSNSEQAFVLYDKSRFGEKIDEKIQYSLSEALYLIENKKMQITSKNKKINFEELLKKLKRIDNKIHLKYLVFKDLRKKGYIVKTALKFGAEFRVYNKGVKPGKQHAKWIVFAENESRKISWHEFSAKNRVAHSTKKRLLLAIIDQESDITYYEINWIRP